MARILVVEDNPTNLELMCYLLQAFGHSPVGVETGEQALEAVQQQEAPELILCDIQLPGMDGYEFARRFREEPDSAGIPLLAVTALAMVGDRDKVLASGFAGYIAKPIDPEIFISQVDSFLSSDRRALAPKPTVSPEPPQPQSPEAVKARVLVVDNSALNIEVTRNMLGPFGYRVLQARSVEEGLEVAEQNSLDLIISDVHMPGQSGFDLIHAVKADPRLRSIAFIFLSSSIMREQDSRVARRLGADAFVPRPVEPQLLLSIVENVLQLKGKDAQESAGTNQSEEGQGAARERVQRAGQKETTQGV